MAKTRITLAVMRIELDVVRSRLQAILNCPNAIEHLNEYDVFGPGYASLLRQDIRQITEIIEQ